MRSAATALVLLGFLLGALGCAAPRSDGLTDAQLCAHLAEQGLEPGSSGPTAWTDPSGRVVFIIGEKKVPSAEAEYSLVIVRPDRQRATVVPLRGVDFLTQWVDADGSVWNVPAFAKGDVEGSGGVDNGASGRARPMIDRSSGLFVVYDRTKPDGPLSVGRMDHPEGWLFTDPHPPAIEQGALVRAKGNDVVISENWSFKVNGVPGPRDHHWVYSPDPANPGRYARTSSYW